MLVFLAIEVYGSDVRVANARAPIDVEANNPDVTAANFEDPRRVLANGRIVSWSGDIIFAVGQGSARIYWVRYLTFYRLKFAAVMLWLLALVPFSRKNFDFSDIFCGSNLFCNRKYFIISCHI